MADSAYDICIVGAGMSGALLANELVNRGLKVVMFDAGPRIDPGSRFERMERRLRGHNPWPSDDPRRDVATTTGSWEYELSGTRFKGVGGSTHHWGGVAYRMHESDFRLKQRYGVGEDWPIEYGELEPYYVRAEQALGVSGQSGDPFSSPRSADFPMPAFPFSYADQSVFKPACDKLGIRLHPVPYARNSVPYQGRPACRAFGVCETCPIEALYNGDVHVRMAEKSGKLTLIPETSVLRFNVSSAGHVASVTYAGHDKVRHELSATRFVLAAHAVESARLLLLSTSTWYPKGLANNHDLVGRYFMEHLGTGLAGEVSQSLYPFRIGFYTAQSMQFCDTPERGRIGAIQLAFAAGGMTPSVAARDSSQWGHALKREVRDRIGHVASIAAIVEHLPSADNRVMLDGTVRDDFGDPAPQMHLSIGSYERRTMRHARSVMSSILDAAGARVSVKERLRALANRFHGVAHHSGGCRMGDTPEAGVVDRHLRAHGLDNLYIVGGSVFVTAGAANPTLTIAALALRAADRLGS